MYWVTVLVLPTCLGAVVDLTHIYGPDAVYPPIGPNGTHKMFNFTIMHRGFEPSLNHWLEINWFGVFEHGSTHIDAPAHYAEGRPHLHEVPVEQLYGPGVMLDMQEVVKADRDYLVTIQDIQNWEKKYGEIPQNSIVMMNTGRHKTYPNRKLFYDTETPDNFSSIHNPGLQPSAARWLMHNRHIKAFGTDTHSCDPGQNHNRNRCHEEFLPNGVLLLEMVANLDRMPPTGSTVFLGPMRMRDGSGGPCRIYAIYDKEGEKIMSGAMNLRFTFDLLILLLGLCVLYM